MGKPNVLFVMADNHPAGLLGTYGNPEIKTPHLDQLAREGLQFNNAFCVNAMCSPCRASVLTGLMPSQHGIHTWIDDRRMELWPAEWNALAEFDTLPEILRRHGYHTALIGKYHLGSPFQPQNGFDHWVTFPHGHTRSFWNNTIIDNGRQYKHAGHIVDFFARKAIDYLEGRQDEDEPFFLFLPFNSPYGHWPAIQGAARHRLAALYDDCPMHSVPREGINAEMVERFLLSMADSGAGLDYSATLRIPNDLTSLRNYFSQMSLLDDAVGQVLSALTRTGQAEKTLVIYSCDHGFSLGSHGFWGHGQATWPANMFRDAYHIPLIVRQPGRVRRGQPAEQLVSQLDLFATILDYVGVTATVPAGSRSFVPLLEGQEATWEDVVYLEQEESRAIRTDRWLYVERFKGSPNYLLHDELYDLHADPDERQNLIDDPEHELVQTHLLDQLQEFFDSHTEPRFDLWWGGRPKSNTSRQWLWPDAWGPDWAPIY